jgi:hypothetical protein
VFYSRYPALPLIARPVAEPWSASRPAAAFRIGANGQATPGAPPEPAQAASPRKRGRRGPKPTIDEKRARVRAYVQARRTRLKAAAAESIAAPEPGAEPDSEAADPEPPRRRCKCCRGSIPAGIPTAKYYSGACRQKTALAPARAQQKAGTPLMGAAIVLALILAGTAADHAAICR